MGFEQDLRKLDEIEFKLTGLAVPLIYEVPGALQDNGFWPSWKSAGIGKHDRLIGGLLLHNCEDSPGEPVPVMRDDDNQETIKALVERIVAGYPVTSGNLYLLTSVPSHSYREFVASLKRMKENTTTSVVGELAVRIETEYAQWCENHNRKLYK